MRPSRSAPTVGTSQLERTVGLGWLGGTPVAGRRGSSATDWALAAQRDIFDELEQQRRAPAAPSLPATPGWWSRTGRGLLRRRRRAAPPRRSPSATAREPPPLHAQAGRVPHRRSAGHVGAAGAAAATREQSPTAARSPAPGAAQAPRPAAGSGWRAATTPSWSSTCGATTSRAGHRRRAVARHRRPRRPRCRVRARRRSAGSVSCRPPRDRLKESRIAAEVRDPDVLVTGTRSSTCGPASARRSSVSTLARRPPGRAVEGGLCRPSVRIASTFWPRLRNRVRTYADLRPELVGAVERLIDFVAEAESDGSQSRRLVELIPRPPTGARRRRGGGARYSIDDRQQRDGDDDDAAISRLFLMNSILPRK